MPASAVPPPEPRRVRVFALAYRQHLERAETCEAYRESVSELVATTVVPHLAGDRPNLIAFPEHQGLMASFIGTRGASGRRLLVGGASAVEALTALVAPYTPQIEHYLAAFPDIDSPGVLLQLALTDTICRAVVETFSALAAEHACWVAVGSNLAPFVRVEGERAALLGDPEAGGGYAYEATRGEVRNRCLWFGPDGQIVDVHDKAYLVPMERDRAGGMGLTGIEVEDLRVADLPFARVGTVISKDAWMPDVTDRYDQLGAELLVQPEAFDTWGRPGDDLWPPDKFQRGGWWMVQKFPSIRANVTPMLTGNLGDLVFDGQPLVAVPGPAGDRALGLLGQPPQPGWAAVGAWDGLGEHAAALADERRRSIFADRAARLAPGSGDPQENAYGEGAAWADVTLPARPAPATRVARREGWPASAALPGPGAQFLPALAAANARAWLAWVDTRRGNQTVFVSATPDGRSWDPPAPVAPAEHSPRDHFDNQWAPAVAAGPDGPVVIYLGFPRESWDLFAVAPTAGGTGWSPPVRLDDAEDVAGVLRERGHSSSTLAAAGSTLVAVWSDLRWPWVLPQIRLARSGDGGRIWSASSRVDGGSLTAREEQIAPRDQAETRGQAFPAATVTGSGTLLAAWQEPDADGCPTVWLARSDPGRDARGSPRRLAGGGAAAWRPALAAEGDTVWLVWEAETAAGGTRLGLRVSGDGGVTWGGSVDVDPSAPAGSRQRNAVLVALGGGRAAVVFEDHRGGDADVLAVAMAAGGTPGAPVRVDDTPDGAHARVPAAAALRGGLLVAWQDTRDPVERIRTVAVPLGDVGEPAAPGRAGLTPL